MVETARSIARLACLGLALLAPAAARAQARAPDELAIGLPATTGSMHPNTLGGTMSSIISFAHRHIAVPDGTWRAVCLICVTLPTIANGGAKVVDLPGGGQGMEVTFRLIPGLSWADGVKVTSRDVVFTWQTGRLPDIGYPNTTVFQHITNITTQDDSSFTLHIDRVSFQYNTPYSLEILPEHIEGPVLRKLGGGKGYPAASAFNTDPTQAGLWDGPYRLARYQPGQVAVMEVNPFWPGKHPYFRRITLRLYPGSAEMVAALERGEIDVIDETYLTPETTHDLALYLGDRIQLHNIATTRYLHVDLNLDRPQFSDPRVRQALLLAIDREAITRNTLGDLRPPAHSFLNPRDPGYDPNVKRYPHDGEAARRLLRQAGFAPAADGVWTRADGTRMAFTLTHVETDGLVALYAQALVEQWRAFGFAVDRRVDPVLRTEHLPHRNFEAAMFVWVTAPELPPAITLSSPSVPTEANHFAGYNYSGFSDPQMDQLIGRLIAELNEAKRPGLWAQVHAIYADALPALPLLNIAETYAIPPWLTGFSPTGHYTMASSFAENWGRDGK